MAPASARCLLPCRVAIVDVSECCGIGSMIGAAADCESSANHCARRPRSLWRRRPRWSRRTWRRPRPRSCSRCSKVCVGTVLCCIPLALLAVKIILCLRRVPVVCCRCSCAGFMPAAARVLRFVHWPPCSVMDACSQWCTAAVVLPPRLRLMQRSAIALRCRRRGLARVKPLMRVSHVGLRKVTHALTTFGRLGFHHEFQQSISTEPRAASGRQCAYGQKRTSVTQHRHTTHIARASKQNQKKRNTLQVRSG